MGPQGIQGEQGPQGPVGPASDADAIPHPVVQIATVPGTNQQWLRVNIYGEPKPGDRLYLRRLSRSGSYRRAGNVRPSLKRMAHPRNPVGAAGGNLPDHLVNRGYFHADTPNGSWKSGASSYIRTEWELHAPNEVIWLMPMSDFLGMYYLYQDPQSMRYRMYLYGSQSHVSFAIDFVVARPDAARMHVSYGPSSSFLRIRPVLRGMGTFDHWGVEFR
ncbi:MAG: hypothetical protein LBU47_06315 [Christensenellaceae bacterium]|jgi:hypothetical protein|nr:hypothetical protein [Christensenellaceae bacterium]